MAEYIEREALLKAVASWRTVVKSLYDSGYDDCINSIEDTISDAPAADVEPVVHAHWICIGDIDENIYECSRCHEIWCLNDGTPKGNNMNYCLNCGAKMDGGKENG